MNLIGFFFFFQAEDGIRDYKVTGVQTCALPICSMVMHVLSVQWQFEWTMTCSRADTWWWQQGRSEEHTSELQSPCNLVCRLLLEKKKKHHLHHAYEERHIHALSDQPVPYERRAL